MKNSSGEVQGFRRLYEFSRLLLSGGEPESLLNRLVEAARVVTNADEVILFKIVAGREEIQAQSTAGPDGEQGDVNYSETLVREVMERGEPLLLKDLPEDPKFGRAQSIQSLHITSAMCSPLFVDGELTGIVYASRKRLVENFSEEDRELMTVAASQAGLLIGRLLSTKALKESEERHRALVEMSPSAILVLQQGVVVFANQAAQRLWGLDNPNDSNFQVSKSRELFDPWRSRRLLSLLEQCRGFDSIDAWVRCPVESEARGVPVEVRGRPIQFDGKDAMQLIVNEVGKQKEVLARRVRTDRLVAMGTMAATVGHEINNPLAYVYANLDFVVEELEGAWCDDNAEMLDVVSRQELMAALRSAREGTERICSVVESIQNFSRLDDEENPATSVDRPLESSLRVARNELGPEVDVQMDIRPTAPVSISAAGLGQVFLNLLINAAQALKGLSHDDDRPRRLELRTRQEGDHVLVEIGDNGPGIDPELKRHIFDPFVSSKGDGEGTGLGLAISAEIVESGGGEIEVESTQGQGTIFRIRLPAVAEPDTRRFEVLEQSEPERRGAILVVDPEPTLGASLRRVLQSQHDVVAVSTCGEAVDLLDGSRSFDVIICDLRLRGGVGLDLFRWVEEHTPHYWERMVAMTASRATPGEKNYLEELPNPWMSKPFDINRLRAIISGILEKVEEEVQAG